MLTSFWTNLAPATAAPTAAQNAAATTPAAFVSWPSAVQASFLRANGTGSPPALVVGAAGSQIFARLGADGASVATTPIPDDYATAPSQVTLAQFSAWDDPIRALYVATYGTGSPPSVTLGGADPAHDAGAFTATLSADGASTATTGSPAMQAANSSVIATPSSSMTAAAFFALPADEQASYVQAQSGTVAGPLAIGGASTAAHDPTITVRIGQRSLGVVVPAASYPGFSSVASGGVSAAAGFLTWPEPVQLAYLQTNGIASPDGLVVQFPASSAGPATTATLGAGGTAVSLHGTPATFGTDAARVTLDAFLSWPAADQAVFVAATVARPFGQITLSNAGGTSATVQRDGGTGFTVTPAASLAGADPASVDPAVFGLLSAADQSTFFAKNAAGQPPSITIGAGTSRVLLTQDGAGNLRQEAYPAAFDTSPAALDPSTFLGWDTAFRLLYAARNGSGTPPGVVIGSGSGAVAVGMPTVNGVTITTFSPIPYYTMPGANSGVTSPINDLTAGTVFPVLDGSGGAHDVTPLPTDFNTSPAALDPSTFTGWDTAVQLQYLNAHPAGGAPLTIGADPNAIHVFAQTTAISGAIPKVYVIENLQKGDIAVMSLADQKTLAASTAFQKLAVGLGLIPDDGTTASDVGNEVVAANGVIYGGDIPDAHAGLKTAMTSDEMRFGTLSAVGYVQQMFVTALNTMRYPAQVAPTALVDGHMAAADLKVFTDEVTLLQQQTSNNAVFSPKDIQDKLTAILTRFKRANAFAVSAQSSSGHYELTSMTGYYKINSPGFDFQDINPYKNYSVANDGHYMVTFYQNQSESPYYGESGAPGTIQDQIGYFYDGANEYSKIQYNGPAHDPSSTASSNTDPDTSYLDSSNESTIPGQSYGSETFYIASATWKWVPDNTSPPPSAASAKSAYTAFMTQEKSILNLANRADQLAGSDTLTDTHQSLDGPNLVYLFQLYANLTGEAVLQADTEEINETNALLNDYAVMQKIINQTVAHIPTPKSGDDPPTSALRGSNADGSFTDAEKVIVAMFSNQWSGSNGNGSATAFNAIESLNGITRPVFDTTQNIGSQQWGSVGTSLSDAVTQINQASQLKMNDINSDTKQKDRQFDLANTALQKAADAISKIASAA